MRERERERELTGTLTHRSKRRRRRSTPTSLVALPLPPLLEGKDRGATWGQAMCALGTSGRSHSWRGEREEPRR